MSKAFCFLCEDLPGTADFKGHEMAVDTRVKTALSCLFFLRRRDVSDNARAEFCSRSLFGMGYGEVLSKTGCTPAELDGQMGRFLAGAPKAERKTADNLADSKPVFDFVQDSGSIIAAFRQNYGLSMLEVQRMHWWEFLALFENLSGETMFSRIKDIRTMKIDKKHDSPERIEAIRRAKRAVAIIDTRTPEEKRADFQAQLNKSF